MGCLGSVATAAAVGVAAWAARQANATAFKLSVIESQRRHSELCPRLRVIAEPWNSGNTDVLRLRVALIGPSGLDQLDKLTVTVRDDHLRWGDGPHQQFAGGLTQEEVKAHIWGPYRFTPGVGPDEARADQTGRTVVYKDELPIGEELPYSLEYTRPGHWMTGMSQPDWLRQRGPIVRLAFTAEHNEHGTWYLPCEIDTESLPATALIPLEPLAPRE